MKEQGVPNAVGTERETRSINNVDRQVTTLKYVATPEHTGA